MGLALDVFDEVTATVIGGGLDIDATGEGADSIPRDESHLIIRTIRTTLEGLGASATGLSLAGVNRIPHGRGLGSSAAAICAGVLLARALVPDGAERLDDAAVLDLASAIEGHPDNVAACLLGGATVAWLDGSPARASSSFRAVRLQPFAGLMPVVFIPPFESSTEQARKLLPSEVSHTDAAFNAARSALLVAALTSDPSALLAATEDRLHQPYRAPAMPESAALVVRLRTDGLAAVISGAGPTVLALLRDDAQVARAKAAAPRGWRTITPAICLTGATTACG